MKKIKKTYSLVIIFITLFIFSCYSNKSMKEYVNNQYNFENPKTEREFRAAWIATVANINWPSKPGLSSEQQKRETIFLLDLLANNNFNAVIFQIRPQCDALYKSDLEPWSYYLTGEQGKAPEPFYDPLEFWIEEAHKRGLELHVWLNPYRAHHINGDKITEHSIVKKYPEISIQLKSGYWWLDPSQELTQNHSYNVTMDILKRYDIDGIHFDDYFYPYPSYNDEKDFPDSISWNNYVKSGGNLIRGDWRRDNVNKFVKRVYEGIKSSKPYVKFGLSPFGIWRPNNPESIKGFDQYDKLFADAKLWLNEGWIDYWSPQLYWKISDIEQSFPVLLNWWESQNYKNRHLWPGMSIDKGSLEVINQIMVTRGIVSESPGNIHWSIAPLVNDNSLLTEIKNGPYKKQALIPELNWINYKKPLKPEISLKLEGDTFIINHKNSDLNYINKWVIYFKYDGNWEYKIISTKIKSFKLASFRNINNDRIFLKDLRVSNISRTGLESDYTVIDLSNL